MRIAFYITGHGFGHSTRAIVTIAELATRNHQIIVITASPPSLFEFLLQEFPNNITIRRKVAALDPGVIQSDPVTVDSFRSIEAMESFLLESEDILLQEIEWLSKGISCVISDAPFLPFLAAKKASIPSFLISNFTFDNIFYHIIDTSNMNHLKMYHRIRNMYDCADYLLRLPGAIPIPAFNGPLHSLAKQMIEITHNDDITNEFIQFVEKEAEIIASFFPKREETFKKPVINLPLIVRSARYTRTEIREKLNIPVDAKVVLISFGGFKLDSKSTPLLIPKLWHVIFAVPTKSEILQAYQNEYPHFTHIAESNCHVPDLVLASDVAVGKCGYSTCAEILDGNIPFVYVSRSGFSEEYGLLVMMRIYGTILEMPREDFASGNWAVYIDQAYKMNRSHSRILKNGGKVAADYIESVFRKSE